MSAKDIRNIVLLGHGGSGKTTLAESMLFMTGGTDRFGKVTDGNTTCDYDAEEIKRNISISLAVAPVKYKNVKINVLDTPGNFDFAGEVLSGIRAAECAVLVCGAKDGLSVGAERAWKMLGNKPRMIFINRTDEENSDYNACFDALKGKFGTAVAPIVAPIIDGSKKVTGIVDLLHNKAYEVKGGKTVNTRIVGVDGPRWMLRGIFSGKAAIDPDSPETEALNKFFADIVVERGEEPLAPRDLIPMHPPVAPAERKAAKAAAEAGEANGKEHFKDIPDNKPKGPLSQDQQTEVKTTLSRGPMFSEVR